MVPGNFRRDPTCRPRGKAEVGVLHEKGAQTGGAMVVGNSGGIRHADGRAEIGLCIERGAQTGKAMLRGNFWRNPTCRPPWESRSRGFA